MNRDNELLRRFVDENAQDAFAALVQEKINLVYAAALRQVGGDAHLAQDVTQGVFIALACQAARLKHHPVLTGWLYSTTRNVAAKAIRTHRRWQKRETEANAMPTTFPSDSVDWQQLRTVIDDAMHDLSDGDRAALLLRFFEGKSHAEVGSGIGLSENAARMRIDRALEKLRSSLSRRGVTSTAAAIALALANQPAVAAPAALATTIASSAILSAGALATSAISPLTLASTLMTTTKLVTGTIAAVAVFAAGAFVGRQVLTPTADKADVQANTRSAEELVRLKTDNQRLAAEIAQLQAGQTHASDKAAIATNNGSTTVSSSNGHVVLSSGNRPPLTPGAIDSLAGKWQILAELQKNRIAQTRIPLIDGSGNLNEAAAKIFDLTPAEHAAITDAVGQTRQRIEELERANATITRNDKGEYVIAVKPFPEAGGQVYDTLMKTFAQTLGPERNAAFVSLAADQVDKAFAQFGATTRTVTVSSDTGSKSNPYSVRDELVSPGSHSTSTSNYKDRDDLLKRVGTITKLLPAGF